MNWRRFLERDQADAEQRRELESYLEIASEENIAAGMSPEQAWRAAHTKLGNCTRIREEVYHMNGIAVLDSCAAAITHWLRTIRREPLFAIVAIATLALGIGATTAIFSVVYGILIQPLPFPHPEELVGVWHTSPGMYFGGDLNIAPSSVFTYRDHGTAFQQVGAYGGPGGVTVTGLAEPEQVRALSVTYGVLQALNVPPLLGRWISQEDDAPGAPQVALLTYSYWQRKFGGDKNVLGRTIIVQSIPREIVGVMPNFQLPRRDPEVILPLQFDRGKVFLGNFAYVGIARLKPGVSLELGNADIARMIPIWMDSWPNPMGPNKTVWINARLGPKLHRLKDDYLGTVANTLWLVMGTVALVLLIACANVANLLLVRAESRQQEWGVRAALGAGRARIVLDSLAESLLLGLTAGAAGVALAYAGVALLKYVQPPGLPRLAEVSVDTTVVAFALVTSIAAGLLFGSIPALKYAGSRLAQTLRSGGRTASSSRERHRFQGSLVIAQVALALVLLVISGLMIRTFAEQRKVQPGFANPEMVQTFRIVIPSAQIPEQERVIRMENDIVDKLAAIPGVTNVGFATSVPMDFNLSNDAILVEGKDYGPGVNPPPRRYKYISPGFLKSTGTRLIAGREQSWSDIYAQRNFAMVSENLAKELWGSPQAALGKHIRDTPVNAWWEVIGVVEDVHDEGVVKKAPAIVYWPIASAQFFGQPKMVQRAVVYAVRGKGVGTEGFLNQVRQAVWSVNSSIPLAQIRTFKDIYEQSMAQTSFAMAILSIAAGMALLLGMVGIYGVIAYTVTQRKREVGIRMALGAQAAQVKRMFLGNGLALSSLGIAAGLLAAAAVSRLMAGLLFGVRPIDPLTYAATSATLLLATAAACYIPARRAATVDPAETLRNE